MPGNSPIQYKFTPSLKSDLSSPSDEHSSDEDSYAGVDQISDSEELEPDVEEEEERAIIYSEDRALTSNRPQISADESWEGISDYPNIIEDGSIFDQENLSGGQLFLEAEAKQEIYQYSSSHRAPSIQLESSDDEFDMFDDVFPDIFIDKDHLDSTFRRQIDPDDVSDDDSYWEHEDVENSFNTSYANPDPAVDNGNLEEGDSDSTFTSYETDIGGETTDDDLPDEYYLKHRKATVHLSDSDSDIERKPCNSLLPQTPRLYSWKHTSDKPFATVSSNCKKMILFNVKVSRHFGANNTSEHLSGNRRIKQPSSSPTISNSAKSMITEMGGLMPNNPGTFPLWEPTETLITPWIGQTGEELISLISSSGYDTDDVESSNAEVMPTNLDEFINFESDDDSDFHTGAAESSSGCVDTNITVSHHTGRMGEEQIHPLISHFNRGVVGSWRQKQNTHKLLNRNIVSQDSLAFGGNQFMEGTLKGVKSGRLRHANTPITPVRKHRNFSAMSMSVDSLPGSLKPKHNLDNDDDNLILKRRKTNA